ncbi:hypothetical protein EXIGLDRAFT_736901 [Exidia glandulosa HHB12029]|uniref:Uncharacterized protein n=1 Tax=Exidia glandulosa HHB12029 TaxID=1314781 RepID=A0A165J9K3_EXIGL|nr:hypothetical protein EXIGLDRAFT_736901 [Exidia glandulosa HHB12029]
MAARLPTELTDCIIDLSRHDLETLEHCSLVSRACRHRAIALLFRAVEVRDSNINADLAFNMNRAYLRSYIQMTAARFAKFIRSESGRRMFAHVRELLFFLSWAEGGLHPVWDRVQLAGIAGHVTSLRLRIMHHDYNVSPKAVALAKRLVEECRTNLELLSTKDLDLLDVVAATGDFTRLRYLHVDRGVSLEAPVPEQIEWPRMSQHHLLRLTFDVRTLARFMQIFGQNEHLRCVIRVTWNDVNQIFFTDGYSICPLVTRFDLSLDIHQIENRHFPFLFHLLAYFPALAALDVSIGYTQRSLDTNAVTYFTELLNYAEFPSSSLRTLVVRDRTFSWEMADLPAAEDDVFDPNLSSESNYLHDYQWEALDATLARPRLRRVQRLVVSLQTRRVWEAAAIQRCMQQYATAGLPTFIGRGGTVRVVCTGTYDYLGQAQLVDACVDAPM